MNLYRRQKLVIPYYRKGDDMKASKLKSGRWRVCLYLGKKDGKEIRKTITGDTKKDAETRAATFMMENHLDDSPMTVGDAVDKYIMDASVSLSPSTVKGYRAIQKYNVSDISSYMADRVTQRDLQTWINALSKEYSPKTVRNAYGLVRAAIKAVRPSFSYDVKLPVRKADIVTIPTSEDVKKMLDAAGEKLRTCIMLAAFCGLRRGEICYLKYGDVKDGCVCIHGDMVKDADHEWIMKDHAKTAKSNRMVRVPSFVLEEIGSGDKDQRIITITPDSITSGFGRLMKRLEMPYHFHLLRHYFASVLISQGIPKDYVQALGGWEDGGSLDRVYTHILQSSQNRYSKKVSDFFSSKFQM